MNHLDVTLPPDTYSVSQLGEELQLILSETLAGVWVAGEVRRLTTSRAGHLYFELVEKGRGDSVVGSIQAVLFRRDYQRVSRILGRAGVQLQEGQTVRCFGAVDFYPSGGRLQFIARDADPVFSLGALARRRQQTLEDLAKRDLLERNRRLDLPELPLEIVLVTSVGSAAHSDFVTTVEQSPYLFQLRTLDVAVQGPSAENEIIRALARCSRGSQGSIVVLVRGGGSKTDLAAFDSLGVAEAIATCALPVLTGLGHEIDESVADLVAYRAFKTPTAVAEFLVRELVGKEQQLELLSSRLRDSAVALLVNARRSFDSAESAFGVASQRLGNANESIRRLSERLGLLARSITRESRLRLESLEPRLRRVAPPSLDKANERLELLRSRLLSAPSLKLRLTEDALLEKEKWVRQLSPERTLQRGFSITRRVDGTLVRSSGELEVGQHVVTALADGEVESSVLRVGGTDAVIGGEQLVKQEIEGDREGSS